jgi:glucose-1-phosphate thymidylyltransferase
VAWVKPVPDPRRFGVAEVNDEGWVTRFIEKPESLDNNNAVVGCYYFQSGEDLMAAIEEQFQRNVQLKNEFFLTDAISIMIERGALVRTETVKTWLDAGTIDATLETNAVLLSKIGTEPLSRQGVEIRPPVFIHETAQVNNSVIGPNVSIGASCKVVNSRIDDSIIDDGTEISEVLLTHSMIGKGCIVTGTAKNSQGKASALNIGDDSWVRLNG